MDENMGGLMSFLRTDPEYQGKKSLVNESGRTEFPVGRRNRTRSASSGSGRSKDQGAHKLFKKRFEDLSPEEREEALNWVAESKVNEENKKPDPSKPNVDAEAVGAEDYTGEDLNKVKSQSLKNVNFAVRQVKDKEVETPIPATKSPTKESKGFLQLCNECVQTFRSMELKCPNCSSTNVEKVVAEEKVRESVSELIGEVPGVSVRNQKILSWAIRNGSIEDQWPEYEDMFDALADAGVEAGDEIQNIEDIQASYLLNILLPKAKNAYMKHVYALRSEKPSEGKVPSKDDDESKIVKKLTEEKDPWREKVVNPLGEALEGTNLGYYYSSSRLGEDGTLVYEFTSVGGGPVVEVHVKPVPTEDSK